MSKDVFFPNIVSNWPVSESEFNKLNLGDVYDHNDNQDLVVIKKMRGVTKNRVNLCRTRTDPKKCAICTELRDCYSPLTAN